MKLKDKKLFTCELIFLLILLGFNLNAQVPRTIAYQGVLTGAAGDPKPDGTYSITFSFYESGNGGDPIWSETKNLQISKGLFSASLGDQAPFGPNVKFDKPYWLAIKVGDEAELTPRIAMTSAGYSLTSSTTLGVENGAAVKSLNGLKDDLILEGGGGTSVNSDGNKITISSSGNGGTGIQGIQNTNNTLDITDPNGPTATVNVKVPFNLIGSVDGSDYIFTANNSGNGHGIEGVSVSGYGVVGVSTQSIGQTIGVAGNSLSPNGYAVSGWNLATTGYSIGVIGRSSSSNGIGIWGDGTRGALGTGVAGFSKSWTGTYGESESGVGVWGKSISSYGVYGTTSGVGQFSIYGQHNSSPSTYGALGYYNFILPIALEYGVYGYSSGGMAGYFVGTVGVTGDFAVSGNKTFKIDHPLDPANKYLIHSCVESPERMNIYNGNIVTDENGMAAVELPAYFQSLNIDYRYQLTVIGQFANAIIETEISNNHFTIRTDKPNVKVSWMVTGIRNDEYAKQHPFVVEQQKEEFAKGKYLMPELFGQPEEKGINYVKASDVPKENDNAKK